MEAIYSIPVKYKAGTYGVNELNVADENAIQLNYSDYGDIVTYRLPDREYDEIRLYGIAKDVLDVTLKADYDANGHLQMLTINRELKKRHRTFLIKQMILSFCVRSMTKK